MKKGCATMLTIDYSIWPVGVLWIQIANFLVLLFALNIIAYRPVRRIMQERNRDMTGLKKQAEDLDEKSSWDEGTLQDKIARVRQEGFTVLEEIKKQSIETGKGMVKEGISSTDKRLKNGLAEIDMMVADVRSALDDEVRAFSSEVAVKILGRSL